MRRELSYRDAIREALAQEMAVDDRVVLIGEDIAGGKGGQGEQDAWGGVLGVTKGLFAKFPGRVLDTPISEAAFMGAAVGAAMTGLRPVVELMFIDFMGVCFDPLLNQAAKARYMFNGQTSVPLVVRAMYGAGLRAAAQHSQSPHAVLTHVPGLKVAMPATPADAKGLLIRAIRDQDPVIFLEHKAMYDVVGEVPVDPYTIDFGRANIVRRGEDVTLVGLGRMVSVARTAADRLAATRTSCEVIDPRTTSPLDYSTIVGSVRRTGRLVVVDEAWPRCSVAADICAKVAEEAFDDLVAPPRMVTAPHTPVPFAATLEDAYIPTAGAVLDAVRQVLSWPITKRNRR
ncbi:alpha-ketoacid dehydrogenase subunit beta [Actinokineospora sp. HUAS TT18]|uniref:alpha-ketoacid dehydrogenase subunit beta n=1 Tax=Actinokineospora sp. HUAS TT18 TaxID=3447451 RepID=UPI003F527E91